MSDPDLKILTTNIRYKLTFGSSEFSFSAPPASNAKELSDILSEAIKSLTAPSKKVLGECFICFKFITDKDDLIMSEGDTVCLSCISDGK